MTRFVLTFLLLGAGLPGMAQEKSTPLKPHHKQSRVWEAGMGLLLVQPGGVFAGLSDHSGIGFFAGTRLLHNRLLVSLQGGFMDMAEEGVTKQWVTANGVINGSINNKSSLRQLGLQTRLYIAEGNTGALFLTAGGGWLRSAGKIALYDIHGDACRMLASERTVVSHRLYGTAGGGVSLFFSKKPARSENPRSFTAVKLDITLQHLAASNISLYNVHSHSGVPPAGARPVLFPFIDDRTGELHQHQAGQVQQGLLRGLQLSMNLTILKSNPKKRY